YAGSTRGGRDELWDAQVGLTGVHEVDAHNVVPIWAASDKLEYAARTIRTKIHRKLPEYLVEYPQLEPGCTVEWTGEKPPPVDWDSLIAAVISLVIRRWCTVVDSLPAAAAAAAAAASPKTIQSTSGTSGHVHAKVQQQEQEELRTLFPSPRCTANQLPSSHIPNWAVCVLCIPFPLHSACCVQGWAGPEVPEVDWIVPGEAAAAAGLKTFLEKRLKGYDSGRNDPSKGPTTLSGLSPWLHYGHIAPQRCALEARKTRKQHSK
ncbi:unnamed protein product, partial [Closterium sp. NIES-53]